MGYYRGNRGGLTPEGGYRAPAAPATPKSGKRFATGLGPGHMAGGPAPKAAGWGRGALGGFSKGGKVTAVKKGSGKPGKNPGKSGK
jgi:hypothetical protein